MKLYTFSLVVFFQTTFKDAYLRYRKRTIVILLENSFVIAMSIFKIFNKFDWIK